jgi:NADPH2:quinone reductase
MRAWLLPRIGSIDALVAGTADDPVAAADEVVLRLRYAALNPADRYLAEGLYPARPSLPHVLGRDGLGIVETVGTGVTGWRPGDEAILLRGEAGVTRPGTLAERVAVPAACLEPVPEGWTAPEAAGGPLVILTAHQALTQWGPRAPEAVLVSGAGGGVGIATVQLAAALGHTVIGLARDPAKAAAIRAAGAALVLDPRDAGWVRSVKDFLRPARVGLVVDTIGGPLLPQLIDTLGMDGRVSVVGMLAGAVPQFNTASLFFRRLRIGGVAVGSGTPEESRAAWRESLSLLSATGRKPLVDSVFGFDDVPAAFARLAAGPLGKVVVEIRGAGEFPAD